MYPFGFLKTTMGDAYLITPGEKRSRSSCSINYRSFAFTNGNKCTGNFRAT